MIFLGLLAYFAATETALTSLSNFKLIQLKEKYPKYKGYVSFWKKKPKEILTTILVGTNLVVIGTGVLSASITLDLSTRYVIYRKYLLICTPFITTVIILGCGEIIPKIFSRNRRGQETKQVHPQCIERHRVHELLAVDDFGDYSLARRHHQSHNGTLECRGDYQDPPGAGTPGTQVAGGQGESHSQGYQGRD